MTENLTPSYKSDTGLWHLTVRVSDHGVSAYLSFKDNESEPPRMLIDTSWPKDREGLMEKIENCIYDHPEVLDDYSATIIVETARNLYVPPSEIMEDGDAERLYQKVYKSHSEDIITDDNGKETILFTLTPGMISFLRRTFPGARVRSHIGLLTEKTRIMGAGIRVFVQIRNHEADILAFNGDNLLSASVQPWQEWSDIVYRVFNLMDVYSLPKNETEINIIGEDSNESINKTVDFLSNEGLNIRTIKEL